MNIGLLILRLVMCLGIMAYGSQKTFGWFGGGGIKGTGAVLESLGYRPALPFAVAASLSEFVGGLLIALGLLNPAGPVLVIAVMLVAIASVHLGHGFFSQNGGAELPVLYLAGAAAIAFTGPGAVSLDHAIGFDAMLPEGSAWIGLIVAVLGAAGNLAMRRSPEAASKGSDHASALASQK
jgi:putative oxidoreductase